VALLVEAGTSTQGRTFRLALTFRVIFNAVLNVPAK
jgi:hypothetical protein